MATRIIDVSSAEPGGERRRFSDDDKEGIVSGAMMPSVSDVARRYRTCSSLVYRWRRALLSEGLAIEAPQLPSPAFLPVEVVGRIGTRALDGVAAGVQPVKEIAERCRLLLIG